MKYRRLLWPVVLLAAPVCFSAGEIGPAESLLVKRLEGLDYKPARAGQTLFVVAPDGAAPKSTRDQVVWRREEFGVLQPHKWEPDALDNPGHNLAEAWNAVFSYLREYHVAVSKAEIFEAEPEFAAYGLHAPGDSAPAPELHTRKDHNAMPYWPAFQGEWGYLSDDYSQLHDAWEQVRQHRMPGTSPARVAILDIGFLTYHTAFPAHHTALFDMAAARRPADSGLDGEPLFPPKTVINGPAHGTATSAILAAPVCPVLDGGSWKFFSGGNPDAELVPIRIGPAVVAAPLPIPALSRTGDVALGFVTAATQKADVLSMSVGGLPSWALADAVNQAYRAGIAMFCASGDFIYTSSGRKSPWMTVYPAAYGNVMAVTGVTALRTPYGHPPAGNWQQSVKSLLLGNFGPSEKMRGNAIAAWGPNVPWVALPDFPETPPAPPVGRSPWEVSGADWSRLDLDGEGTSANTPQVAAAASLLAEYRRNELQVYAEPWQRAEAIYQVLRESAEKPSPANVLFFGAGFLRARAALEVADWPKPDTLRSHRARNGFHWLRLILSAFLPLPSPDAPDQELRSAAGRGVMEFLSDLPDQTTPGDGYAQAVAVAIETEIAQNVASSRELQDLLAKHPSPRDAAARTAILDLLLQRELSHPTRQFLESVRRRQP